MHHRGTCFIWMKSYNNKINRGKPVPIRQCKSPPALTISVCCIIHHWWSSTYSWNLNVRASIIVWGWGVGGVWGDCVPRAINLFCMKLWTYHFYIISLIIIYIVSKKLWALPWYFLKLHIFCTVKDGCASNLCLPNVITPTHPFMNLKVSYLKNLSTIWN